MGALEKIAQPLTVLLGRTHRMEMMQMEQAQKNAEDVMQINERIGRLERLLEEKAHAEAVATRAQG